MFNISTDEERKARHLCEVLILPMEPHLAMLSAFWLRLSTFPAENKFETLENFFFNSNWNESACVACEHRMTAN